MGSGGLGLACAGAGQPRSPASSPEETPPAAGPGAGPARLALPRPWAPARGSAAPVAESERSPGGKALCSARGSARSAAAWARLTGPPGVPAVRLLPRGKEFCANRDHRVRVDLVLASPLKIPRRNVLALIFPILKVQTFEMFAPDFLCLLIF